MKFYKSQYAIVSVTPEEIIKATFAYKIATNIKQEKVGYESFRMVGLPYRTLDINYRIGPRGGVKITRCVVVQYEDSELEEYISSKNASKNKKYDIYIPALLDASFLYKDITCYRVVGGGWGSGQKDGAESPSTGVRVENVFASLSEISASRIAKNAITLVWEKIAAAIQSNGSKYLKKIGKEGVYVYILEISAQDYRAPLLNEKAGHSDYFDSTEVFVINGTIVDFETINVLEMARNNGWMTDILEKMSDEGIPKGKIELADVKKREDIIQYLNSSKASSVPYVPNSSKAVYFSQKIDNNIFIGEEIYDFHYNRKDRGLPYVGNVTVNPQNILYVEKRVRKSRIAEILVNENDFNIKAFLYEGEYHISAARSAAIVFVAYVLGEKVDVFYFDMDAFLDQEKILKKKTTASISQ